MNLDAKRENARMLASVLGLNDGEADSLLDASILLTASSRVTDEELAFRVERLLKKTFTDVARSLSELRGKPQIEVIFGNAAPAGLAPMIFVMTGHEEVLISDVRMADAASLTSSHPCLLSVSAPYVCARVTKLLFPNIPFPSQSTVRINLRELLGVDTDALSDDVDVGRTDLVGAGAVGTAFVRALSDFDLKGEIRIFDDDDVSGGNLNRCDFFDDGDIGHKKALVLVSKAQGLFEHLQLNAQPIRLDGDAVGVTGGKISRMVIAADSRRVRRHLQKELPIEVYDASTTGIEEVVLHFNRLASSKACLSCVYKQDEVELAHEKHVAELLGVPLESVMRERVSQGDAQLIVQKYAHLKSERLVGQAYDSLFKQLCGAGALKTSADRQVLAPFAFVSALAGAFLALEFVRRVRKKCVDQPFNCWRISPWSSPVLRLRADLSADSACEFHSDLIAMRVAKEHLAKMEAR